jgi:hypothetical protein
MMTGYSGYSRLASQSIIQIHRAAAREKKNILNAQFS